jgi:hypothetical protein
MMSESDMEYTKALSIINFSVSKQLEPKAPYGLVNSDW